MRTFELLGALFNLFLNKLVFSLHLGVSSHSGGGGLPPLWKISITKQHFFSWSFPNPGHSLSPHPRALPEPPPQAWVGMPPGKGSVSALFSLDPDPAKKNYFENIFRVQDHTDVTLASEGETKNKAHKMVLISASHKKIQQKVEQ